MRHIGPEGFDPSDQFLQAYRAGFLKAFPGAPKADDEYIWYQYIDWLHEEGVTT